MIRSFFRFVWLAAMSALTLAFIVGIPYAVHASPDGYTLRTQFIVTCVAVVLGILPWRMRQTMNAPSVPYTGPRVLSERVVLEAPPVAARTYTAPQRTTTTYSVGQVWGGGGFMNRVSWFNLQQAIDSAKMNKSRHPEHNYVVLMVVNGVDSGAVFSI